MYHVLGMILDLWRKDSVSVILNKIFEEKFTNGWRVSLI